MAASTLALPDLFTLKGKVKFDFSPGLVQQLAAGRPSHPVWLFRPGGHSHGLHQAQRGSHPHHRRRLGLPVRDGASRTLRPG